jgi:transcriptional regulator with XRE-family HTH domain
MDFVKEDSKIFLANNIRCLRKKLSLSQEELANKIGLNRGNIASYEKGTAEPKICNLLKLANFFKVSLLDLTKRDIQNGLPAQQVNNGNAVLSTDAVKVLDKFNKNAVELQEVLDSLHCYHCFKMKSIDELPKDMQMIVANFDKLYEVTQVLMDSHKELIGFVKSKCPHSSEEGKH